MACSTALQTAGYEKATLFLCRCSRVCPAAETSAPCSATSGSFSRRQQVKSTLTYHAGVSRQVSQLKYFQKEASWVQAQRLVVRC